MTRGASEMSDRTKFPQELFIQQTEFGNWAAYKFYIPKHSVRYIQADPAEKTIDALKCSLDDAQDEVRRLTKELYAARKEAWVLADELDRIRSGGEP